ncbi:MAG: Crp/Fnr family transcriptional regulator [Gemmatimonadales bacterium]|nr:MAG: Crp/Fnr family transcriptional regulator [Gemmatimonadales bacterium]
MTPRISSARDPARAALAGLGLFRSLSAETLGRVADRTVSRAVPARQRIFRRGEPCEGLFVVLSGRVRVYRANREGREQVLHDQGPGQPLAEVPLFDGGPYPADARAEEDSELLFLHRRDFERLYHEESELADAVIRELGRRLRRAVGLIEKISLKDVPSRVALSLLEYSAGSGTADGHWFTLPRTQSELAAELATTRESVARALRTLRDEGLVEQEGAQVRIPDSARLEDRARFS